MAGWCRVYASGRLHDGQAPNPRLDDANDPPTTAACYPARVPYIRSLVRRGGFAVESEISDLTGTGLSLKEAKAVLEKLEEGRSQTGGIAAGLDTLPLFAAAPQAAPSDPLADAIEAIDPDSLTPREALDALYRLKALAKE